jgi:hypothetical protein
MRKIVRPALISSLVALALLVAVFAAGCGTTWNSAGAQPGPSDPQAILNQAIAATGNISAATGDFNATITVNTDQSQLPSGVQAFLGQPITVSGTYALSESPEAADISAQTVLAGQNLTLGLRAVNDQAWIEFMGQWYELPADMMQQGTATTATTEMDAAALMQTLTAAGVDPSTWLANLTIVGQETINGTPTYHLTGSVDINQIMTDLNKLAQSPDIQKLLPGIMEQIGSMGSDSMMGTNTSVTLPSEQDLQNIESEISSALKNFTVDMWIATDTYELRQASVNATIAAPAGEDSQGINSVVAQATLTVNPASSGQVNVTPPADAKPFSDLQQTLEGLMGLFSGFLGGGSIGSGTAGQ